MGKRKVLNESALKEIRLAEEGEMYGRVIKLLGSDQVLVNVLMILLEEEEFVEN